MVDVLFSGSESENDFWSDCIHGSYGAGPGCGGAVWGIENAIMHVGGPPLSGVDASYALKLPYVRNSGSHALTNQVIAATGEGNDTIRIVVEIGSFDSPWPVVTI